MGTEFGTLQIRQHIRSVEITSVDCIVFNKCLNVFKWSLFRPKLKKSLFALYLYYIVDIYIKHNRMTELNNKLTENTLKND